VLGSAGSSGCGLRIGCLRDLGLAGRVGFGRFGVWWRSGRQGFRVEESLEKGKVHET